MSKYLVTGGCGFIGSHLCRTLISQGHDVIVLDNLDTGKRENLAEGATLVEDSILNEALIETLFADIDGCFHLAAIASVVRCQQEWLYAHKVNSQGHVNLLNAAKPRKVPVVFASSAAVYGDLEQMPLEESASVKQISLYAVDKFNCEQQSRVAYEQFQIPSIGLRFFNVYGEGQDPASPYSGVISIFTDRIRAQQPITIFGDGEQTRDFIFVDDVVQYLCLSMQQCAQIGFDVFNVCSGQSYSLNDLVATLSALYSYNQSIHYAEEREGDIKHSLGSPSKVIAALGYEPQYDLESGLKLFLGV